MIRHGYRNIEIKDDRLPFVLEISRSLTVYYKSKKGNGELRKALSRVDKKTNEISVSVEGFVINIKGRDPITREIVYEIKETGE